VDICPFGRPVQIVPPPAELRLLANFPAEPLFVEELLVEWRHIELEVAPPVVAEALLAAPAVLERFDQDQLPVH